MTSDIYYFGVWSKNDLGHFLFKPGRRNSISIYNSPPGFPLEPRALDGGLLNPNERGVEGVASVWRGEGWTIVTFCDRSADTRPGCSSSFVCRGDLGLDEVMAKAREAFPSIVERFDFEIRARTP